VENEEINLDDKVEKAVDQIDNMYVDYPNIKKLNRLSQFIGLALELVLFYIVVNWVLTLIGIR